MGRTQQARAAVMGRRITDEINADPEEAEALRRAREAARLGKRGVRRGEGVATAAPSVAPR